jgi:hypothetical protein
VANDILRYIELTEEAEYAPVAPYAAANAKSVFIDPRSIAMDVPGESDAIVPSAFGRAPNRKFAGFYAPSGDFSYNGNVRNLAHCLKWVLGGYAFTAGVTPGTDPNLHESWGSDTRILPSVQGRFGKDNFEHLFSGIVFDTLSIEVEDELAIVTVEANASKDAKAALQTPAAVLAALPVELEIPFSKVTVTFGGVVQARKVKTLTFNIGNNSDPEMGRYLGSRYAGRIPANERETTIEAEVDFSDTAEIERIWGSPTGPSDEGSATFPVELTFAGTDGQSCTVQLPKFFWQTVETQPEEREEITQALEGRALSSSVTLDDGATDIVTDVYTKTLTAAPIVEAAAA